MDPGGVALSLDTAQLSGREAKVVVRDEPPGHARPRALEFKKSHGAGNPIGAGVAGVDGAHMAELAVVARCGTAAELRLQRQRKGVVDWVVDLERAELLDVPV